MPPSEPAPAPFPLAPPFAAVGLVGGWLTADLFHLRGEPIRWLLVIATPLTAAALGGFLTSRRAAVAEGRKPPRPRLLELCFTALAIGIAGLVNGMSVGLLLAPPVGLVFGAFFGVVCVVPFLPALLLLVLAADRVGRARPGSIVDASDRRAVPLATAAVIAHACLAVHACAPSEVAPLLPLLFAATACAAVALFFAADAVALTRVLVLGARAPRAPAPHGAWADAPERVDLGLGDDARADVLPSAHAYRGVDRVVRVVRGSPPRAAAALRVTLACGAAALALAAALWTLG